MTFCRFWIIPDICQIQPLKPGLLRCTYLSQVDPPKSRFQIEVGHFQARTQAELAQKPRLIVDGFDCGRQAGSYPAAVRETVEKVTRLTFF